MVPVPDDVAPPLQTSPKEQRSLSLQDVPAALPVTEQVVATPDGKQTFVPLLAQPPLP